MSVPEGKREKTTLEVFIKARALASYTIKITSNKNIFLPEYEHILTQKITDTALNIYLYAWEAQCMRMDRNNQNQFIKKQKQIESIAGCDKLLALISIAKDVFHLRINKIDYWTEQTLEVKKLLQIWYENNKKNNT